jgi:hypothetical protein
MLRWGGQTDAKRSVERTPGLICSDDHQAPLVQEQYRLVGRSNNGEYHRITSRW